MLMCLWEAFWSDLAVFVLYTTIRPSAQSLTDSKGRAIIWLDCILPLGAMHDDWLVGTQSNASVSKSPSAIKRR